MTYMAVLKEIELKSTSLSAQEIARNKHFMALGQAVGAFEDVELTPETKRLSQLVAEGRISTKEAAQLALKHA